MEKKKRKRFMQRVASIILALCMALGFVSFTEIQKVQAAGNPDWNSSAYNGSNPYATNGYYGQCTWYAWGRAYEVMGKSLPCIGNGGTWYDAARNAGWSVGSEPAANSIAVWEGGSYGHVAYVESAGGGSITISEANFRTNYLDAQCWSLSVGIQYYEGVRTLSAAQMQNRYGITLLGYIYLGEPAGNNPQGVLDGAVGGAGTVHVSGWAFDRDDASQSLGIHVYIGGPAGSGEGHGGIVANVRRDDVNNAYGTGIYHGYDAVIETSLVGTQEVYVYAINIGGGDNQQIGKATVTIAPLGSPLSDDVQGDESHRAIADGDYVIASATAGSRYTPGPYYLDIQYASQENGGNLWLWGDNENGSAQIFTVTWLGNGFYKIKVKYSGKSLDVDSASLARGANVWQYEDNGSSAQQWRISETGDGNGYKIQAKCNGFFLDVAEGKSGSNVYVWSGHELSNQRWFLIPANVGESVAQDMNPSDSSSFAEPELADGEYRIVPKLDFDMNLHAARNGMEEGTNIELGTAGAVGTDLFKVKWLGNGYYEIADRNSDIVLDVVNAKSKNGTIVALYARIENYYNKQWLIRSCGDGYFNIISKCNGLYLDCPVNPPENGTNVHMWCGHGGNNQKWRFIPWGESIGQTAANGTYRLVPKSDSSKSVNISENGADLEIGNREAAFDISSLGNGYYSIADRKSGLLLETADSESGGKAGLLNSGIGRRNQWMLKPCGDGSYNLISNYSGLYLGLEKIADTENVRMRFGNESETQKWQLISCIPIETLALDRNELTLAKGALAKLQAVIAPEDATDKSLAWTSSDTSVAEVDGSGNVAAKSAGTATITVTSANGKTATCRVAVEELNTGCTHSYKTIITPATIAKDGSIVEKCSKCGNERNKTVIYATGSVSLTKTSYAYSGKAQKPSVMVKDSRGKTLRNNTDYTVTYPHGLKNVGRYAVTVTLKGNYSGTVKKTFDITPKGTSISKLTAGKRGFSAKWGRQTVQTAGYEIAYSTNSRFPSKDTKILNCGKSGNSSKTVFGLKAKKKYYVKIRTYKTVKVNGKSVKLYSEWSRAKTVTTKK